ncbi:MAG: flavodoxin family protein [Candidatus Bathyarchaeaceae archaeon]
MVKVLAFNCSPKMEKGNTALILTPFLEGMRGAGAKVELFYTIKLKINPCTGEFNCWTKTPGRCYQNDDMNMLLPKLGEADIWVFATPVYVWGVSGTMKNLMDRMIPLALPFFELRDGHCCHPPREGTKRGKVVLVSTCGFWEMDNFDPLLVHMEAFCKYTGREFAGALLRPHGGGLRRMMGMGMPMDDIFEAAKEAGRQLVRKGKMSPETLKIVSRELMPLEILIQAANATFQQALDAKEIVTL